ncbi:MAG: glycoside hydrolase family 97 catalytic domain-containing protein [Bacteroidales bacterium]|nr:glycoside hydrolase family 97 catalytic domain-containing protein [Bacteroidales bacterium]
MCAATFAMAEDHGCISSPNGVTDVYLFTDNGKAYYQVEHHSNPFISTSRLGLVTNAFDFSELEYVGIEQSPLEGCYEMNRTKASKAEFKVNQAVVTFRNPKGETLQVEFRVGNNDVAFRYIIPKAGETGSVRIMNELTEFSFNDSPSHNYVKTYLTPQSHALIGWKRTKPSYEEYYGIGNPVDAKNDYGHGYTFPALFQLGGDGWVLVSETGVDGRFCGSRLSEYYETSGNVEGLVGASYKIEFPMPDENNGNGTSEPAIAIPGATPWRTITLGKTLAPIVETTVAWDHIEPLYETKHDYKFGKSAWSWIVWQDASMNMPDQKAYVDFASEMGLPYLLVDALWDEKLGYEGIEELAAYAKSKNVDLFLWYSSSGWWNDIVQGPYNIMSNPILRKRDMRWMKEIGVKGIKVDFFGGDKQETMLYYESILSDADDNGLMCIFHGATLPRGWEKLYPNYVGSEAVRASENLVFSQYECEQEAQAACLHPFIRNAVGSMEFGGCFLNERLSRGNNRGTTRRTTDVFQIGTLVLYQNAVQMLALAPNNLTDAPQLCLDFVKEVPTTWDETRYIAGFPGENVVLARRNGDKWYVVAVNAVDQPLEVNVKDVLKELGIEKASVRLIDGGNDPKESKASASTKISVSKNDAAVLVIG